MIGVLVTVVAILWVAVALLAAVAIGMGIAEADRREPKPCRPHPSDGSPETVRGECRAVVVPIGERRGTRLDVRT